MQDRKIRALQEAMPQIFGAAEMRVTPRANRLAMAALLEAFDGAPAPTVEEALAMARYLSAAAKEGPL